MARGAKTGGRVKGVPNRVTAAKIAEIEASGLTPLDFMLDVLRDATREFEQRFDAAKSAAPYCHARLANVDATVSHDISDDLRELLTSARDRVLTSG